MRRGSSMSVYKGGQGMWAWVFHRVAGLGVFLFLLVHIADTSLIGWGPKYYNMFVHWYRHPIFRVSEVLLAAALLFHALNGIRIMIIDFWEAGTARQRPLLYGVIVVFLLLFIPGAYIMMRPLFVPGG
jgi:succinate dehydrogenase / fumarate reductase, cytochrome b subunit